MKQASVLITVIIAVAVLLSAFGVGHGIKQIRIHRAQSRSLTVVDVPEPGQDAKGAPPAAGGGPRTAAVSVEPRRGPGPGGMVGMRERFENMSDEERRQLMAERSGRFGEGRRQGTGDRRRPQLSEEERQAMRERYENMTDEEREAFREQMRQRFGGARRPGGRGPGDGSGFSPEEGARRRPAEGARRRPEEERRVRENPD